MLCVKIEKSSAIIYVASYNISQCRESIASNASKLYIKHQTFLLFDILHGSLRSCTFLYIGIENIPYSYIGVLTFRILLYECT